MRKNNRIEPAVNVLRFAVVAVKYAFTTFVAPGKYLFVIPTAPVTGVWPLCTCVLARNRVALPLSPTVNARPAAVL